MFELSYNNYVVNNTMGCCLWRGKKPPALQSCLLYWALSLRQVLWATSYQMPTSEYWRILQRLTYMGTIVICFLETNSVILGEKSCNFWQGGAFPYSGTTINQQWSIYTANGTDIITCMNTKITVFQDEMHKDRHSRFLQTLDPIYQVTIMQCNIHLSV